MNGNQLPSLDLSFLRGVTVRRRVAGATLACAVVGGLYGLFGPRWYASTVTVVPAKSQKSGGLSTLLGGDLGSLGGLAGGLDVGGLGGGADAARIAAVLKSVAVTDAVVAKFDLKRRYDKVHQERARDELWRHCDVRTLPKPNMVQISCEDRDPAFVKEMLGYFAEYGNEVFRRVNVSSATEEVRFLERRVADLRHQADEISGRMRDFQEKHKIVDLDTQAKAVVSSVAMLNAQRISKQMELGYVRTFASADEPGSRQLESQLEVVEGQLRDMEAVSDLPAPLAGSGGARREPSPGMFPAALAVPRLRAEFEKLYRDRKVAEATLVFALDRLENARANEARDVSTFVIMDPPTLPERKSRPRGTESAVIGALLGLLASVGFEWWRSLRAAGRTSP